MSLVRSPSSLRQCSPHAALVGPWLSRRRISTHVQFHTKVRRAQQLRLNQCRSGTKLCKAKWYDSKGYKRHLACRAKDKEAKEDPVADRGSKKAEPIKEGPFGLKSSKEGQEEGPVDEHQVKHPTQRAAGKFLGHKHASKLDEALNTVEHEFISTSDCALKDIVGAYEFKDEEKGVFRYLVSVMRRLAVGNFALAAASIAVTASKVSNTYKCVRML